MDGRLYQASLRGNTTSLLELLEEDELLLDRVLAANIPETPLHLAALRGHLTFASEILQRRPEMALELNSEGLSALHLASANGHVGIVEEILKLVPDTIWVRDRRGRTPLHTASMKGRVEVLTKIACRKPDSVQDLTSLGETALHLCAKHDHLEALKMMVGLMADAVFVNCKDANGNTVLHLASALKNFPMIKFLLEETRVEVNKKNANCLTALDVLTLYPKESSGDLEMAEFLRQKGAKRAWELSKPSSSEVSEIVLAAGDPQCQESHPSLEVEKPGNISPQNQEKNKSGTMAALESLSQQIKEQWVQEMKQKHDDDKKNTMMVVAILVITVTIQATLTPPGGLWQDDSNINTTYNYTNATLRSEEYHHAGTAILNNKNPTFLAIFWFFNKLAFFASLMLILRLSETDEDEEKTVTEVDFARQSRNAVYFCAWCSMELMYISSSLPILGNRLRVIAADVGAVVLVLLLMSPRSHKLWRKLRCKDKKEKLESDGDGDIAIETQK